MKVSATRHPSVLSRWRIVGVAMAAVMAVAGCSRPASPAPSGTPEGSGSSTAPAPSASGEQLGGKVAVIASWGGSEQDSFFAMVQPWEERTGTKVEYTETRNLNAVLTTGVASGILPDLAGLPGPGQLAEYAKQVLRLFRDSGNAGSYLSVWLAHTAYALPFAVYLLRNAMGGLPSEVFESAEIDGAGPATSFFRLAVPMTLPAIASLAIFQFIFVWNDLLVSLVYLGATNANKVPLTVLVANLQNSRGGEWQYLMAAAFVSMLLPLVLFFGFQRYFVRGIATAAVKG